MTDGRFRSSVTGNLIADFTNGDFEGGLRKDIQQLRQVAVRHMMRAAVIKDEEVARRLVSEAAVMLTVVTKVEQYFDGDRSEA